MRSWYMWSLTRTLGRLSTERVPKALATVLAFASSDVSGNCHRRCAGRVERRGLEGAVATGSGEHIGETASTPFFVSRPATTFPPRVASRPTLQSAGRSLEVTRDGRRTGTPVIPGRCGWSSFFNNPASIWFLSHTRFKQFGSWLSLAGIVGIDIASDISRSLASVPGDEEDSGHITTYTTNVTRFMRALLC
eukprot:277962-Prorocentrum_minimum.AAC.1